MDRVFIAGTVSNSPEIGWVLVVTAELNLWQALFNMLPLMPLDGGRLLFALLTRIMSANSAARVSGFTGLVGVLLWIPMMIFAYVSFGFVFLFFPPILRHWQMLRYARY